MSPAAFVAAVDLGASSGRVMVGSVGPGEVVGELAMLGDGHRKATLVARYL